MPQNRPLHLPDAEKPDLFAQNMASILHEDFSGARIDGASFILRPKGLGDYMHYCVTFNFGTETMLKMVDSRRSNDVQPVVIETPFAQLAQTTQGAAYLQAAKTAFAQAKGWTL